MNWQSYEELVKYVYERLGQSANIEIVCWGPSCTVRGKSGASHQIDVLHPIAMGFISIGQRLNASIGRKRSTKIQLPNSRLSLKTHKSRKESWFHPQASPRMQRR